MAIFVSVIVIISMLITIITFVQTKMVASTPPDASEPPGDHARQAIRVVWKPLRPVMSGAPSLAFQMTSSLLAQPEASLVESGE